VRELEDGRGLLIAAKLELKGRCEDLEATAARAQQEVEAARAHSSQQLETLTQENAALQEKLVQHILTSYSYSVLGRQKSTTKTVLNNTNES